jgi:hypothetical protein
VLERGKRRQQGYGPWNILKNRFLTKFTYFVMWQGVIPADRTQNLGGSWSALTAAGEATNLNIVHLSNIDCTDVEDLTKVTCDVI